MLGWVRRDRPNRDGGMNVLVGEISIHEKLAGAIKSDCSMHGGIQIKQRQSGRKLGAIECIKLCQ
jgi:hypothetical protein